MPDTRQRKLAWKMWLASCLVVIFFGATAYLTTDDIMKSTGAELLTVEAVLGKWPQEQALGWWLSLQLDEVQATLVEAIDNGNRTSDPLYWVGEKLNAFLIGCVVNAFHLLFLFFLRVAACCQWAIYCLPLALISLAVGFLQREVNRQTFSFSSPYRFAVKYKVQKWFLVLLVGALFCPWTVSPYVLFVAVWVLTALPGVLIAGLQKEL